MRLFVALGNPGEQYKNTPHNIGEQCLLAYAKNSLADEAEWQSNKRLQAEILKFDNNGETVYFMLPHTYMNESGTPVRAILDYYKIPLDNLIVIHDDVSFALGKAKITSNNSAGGHNGVADIIEKCGGKNFGRIRLGVNSPLRKKMELDKFVLHHITADERDGYDKSLAAGEEALDLVLKHGLANAQNLFNRKEKDE
ncbi:MAG TPA: aminoacyl-tRNA hydrolase [bacterium]|nr:aminoacyl-tRNA hydrolase [bacterium]